MTEEELEKEAIKYAVDYPTNYEKGYKHKDLRIAYLAGAEPREKRIAELEEINAGLKQSLDWANEREHDDYVKIQALEKENAELQNRHETEKEKWYAEYTAMYDDFQKQIEELEAQIEAKDIQVKELQEQKYYWKESSFDWRHKFFKKDKVKRLVKKDKQLTKAKEIIKYLLSFIQKENYRTRWDINITEAEQFLKESE